MRSTWGLVRRSLLGASIAFVALVSTPPWPFHTPGALADAVVAKAEQADPRAAVAARATKVGSQPAEAGVKKRPVARVVAATRRATRAGSQAVATKFEGTRAGARAATAKPRRVPATARAAIGSKAARTTARARKVKRASPRLGKAKGGAPPGAPRDMGGSATTAPSSPPAQPGPLREAGAHQLPASPPLQLEGRPRTDFLRSSAAVRMRSIFARHPNSPLQAPEVGEIWPVRLAMLRRLDLVLPDAARPRPFRLAPPSLAPGPWTEQHMEPEAQALGRWAPPSLPRFYDPVHFAAHAPPKCLPARLKKIIYEVAARVGEVRVISTYRDPSRNRRVGGARRSMHLECRAIDFVVPGRHLDLRAFLRTRPEVGGYARYSGGSYHIDDGPRRTW